MTQIEPMDNLASEPAERTKASAGRMSRHMTAFGIRAASVLSSVLLWAAVAAVMNDASLLPGPWVVFERLAELIRSEQFFFHAGATVCRVMAGFCVAMVLGSMVGIAMGIRQEAEQFLDIYILIGLTIPGLAWALLSVMWFGVSEVAPVFSIVMVVAPMLAVNVWQGTKAIDKQLLDMSRAFHISRHRVLSGIIIPQLAPYLLAASRFGFGLGWKVVVLSEIFGQTNGIGYMLNRGFARFSMPDVLAWTLGFTLVMFVFEYGILQPIERRVLRWRPKLRF